MIHGHTQCKAITTIRLMSPSLLEQSHLVLGDNAEDYSWQFSNAWWRIINLRHHAYTYVRSSELIHLVTATLSPLAQISLLPPPQPTTTLLCLFYEFNNFFWDSLYKGHHSSICPILFDIFHLSVITSRFIHRKDFLSLWLDNIPWLVYISHLL